MHWTKLVEGIVEVYFDSRIPKPSRHGSQTVHVLSDPKTRFTKRFQDDKGLDIDIDMEGGTRSCDLTRFCDLMDPLVGT